MIQNIDSVKAGKLLLALAYKKGIVLNVTQVQKLLYIIYGYFLAQKNIQIFNETPKAWPYGPVFPHTRKIKFNKVYEITDNDIKDIFNEELITIFNKVIDKYAKFTAGQLSDWSHTKGGAWDKTTQLTGFDWNNPIPNQFIKEYFSELIVI